MRPAIDVLAPPLTSRDLDDLAALLVDAIDAGASVSFLPPLSIDRARDFWREMAASCEEGAVILAARDDAGIVGTVQFQPAWAPNQPHRAEIAKLLVHRRARRRGVGRALMREIEVQARAAGRTLLTLDTRRGGAAETLFEQGGWTRVGVIPGFALNADGTPADTVLFYKRLDQSATAAAR